MSEKCNNGFISRLYRKLRQASSENTTDLEIDFEMANKRTNIWLGVMGAVFGISSLFICVFAIIAGIIEDLGISLLVLPIIVPVMLIVFRRVTKYKFRDAHFGIGGVIRWIIFGSITGMAYIVRIVIGDTGFISSVYGMLLLLSLFVIYWLLFEQKKTQISRK